MTRSMLDRRNANFLLWPPCVEVQRCSGCCNSRQHQCVPTVTSSRYLQVRNNDHRIEKYCDSSNLTRVATCYIARLTGPYLLVLQVIKIQYINKKAHYDKAIISVEDHVSCRCQPPSPSSSSSSSSSFSAPMPRSPIQGNPPPQQPPPPPHLPRPVHPAPPKPHTSKADLHRHDDLKHNQHYSAEEREPVARQWQQGSYTQLVHWTQPRVPPASTHVQAGGGPVSSWPSEARAEHNVMGSAPQVALGSGSDGSREEGGVRASNGGGEEHHLDHAQRQQQLLQHQQKQQYQYHPQQHQSEEYSEVLRSQHRLNTPQSDSASSSDGPTQPPKSEQNPTLPIPTNHKDSVTSQTYIEVTNQQTAAASHKVGNEREESGSANSGDSASAELANQGQGKDSKLTSGDGHLTEEERRQKLLEMVQSDLDRPPQLHPHPPQQRPKPGNSQLCVFDLRPQPAS